MNQRVVVTKSGNHNFRLGTEARMVALFADGIACLRVGGATGFIPASCIATVPRSGR